MLWTSKTLRLPLLGLKGALLTAVAFCSSSAVRKGADATCLACRPLVFFSEIRVECAGWAFLATVSSQPVFKFAHRTQVANLRFRGVLIGWDALARLLRGAPRL